METATQKKSRRHSANGRFSRIARAREYARMHGWQPLTPEEKEDFRQMLAECTNL